jgi:hypothetical protein
MIRIAAVFIFFGAVLLFVFNRAEHHADDVSLPRYCVDPDRHVELVEKILREKNPAGDDARRPYVIAAKLIYIIPRRESEPLQSYLLRIRQRILDSCH